MPTLDDSLAFSARGSSSPVATLPSGAAAGHLGLIIIANDDATSTQQWDGTTYKPTGWEFINESGSATPDVHLAMFYKILNSADITAGTVTVPTQSASNVSGVVTVWSDYDAASLPPFATADLNTGNQTTYSMNVADPGTGDVPCDVVAAMGFDGDDATLTLVNATGGDGWVQGGTASDGSGSGVGSSMVWGYNHRTSAGTTPNPNINSGAVSDGRSGFSIILIDGSDGPGVGNTPPTADAGADQFVRTNTGTVTLDGTGSVDGDGTITDYAWSQLSGTTVTLSSATATQPTFTAPTSPTTLVFQLEVTDNDGATATDTVTITVTPVRRVAIIGDSLTERDDTDTSGNRYDETLAQLFAAGVWSDCANTTEAALGLYWYGRGGKRMNVADSLGNLTTDNIAAARAQMGTVDVWIIALGTNDVVVGTDGSGDATFNAHQQAILDAINGEGITYWIPLAFWNPANTNALYFNPLLRANCEAASNTVYADWFTAVHNPFDSGDWIGSSDPTHMTTQGYTKRDAFIADRIVGLTPVTVTRATTWDVAGTTTPVSTTRATTWDVLTPVSVSRATTWDALTPVAVGRSTTWATLTAASVSRSTSWDALTSTATARATTWRVLTSVETTRATTWTVTASVSTSRTTTWDVAGALSSVSTSRTTTWRVLTDVVTGRATTWDVLAVGQVATSRTTTWTVYAAATASRPTSWDVLEAVAASRTTSWRVLAPAVAAWATTWTVLAAVAATRDTTWQVETGTAPTITPGLVVGKVPASDYTGKVGTQDYTGKAPATPYVGKVRA